MMNGADSSGKKPALCRYFASTGSCFYGNDCQFSHENGGIPPRAGVRKAPPLGNGVIDPLNPEENSAGGDGNNGDQYFSATFAAAASASSNLSNGIAPPPKLQQPFFHPHKRPPAGSSPLPAGGPTSVPPPAVPGLPDGPKAFIGPPPTGMEDLSLSERLAVMSMAERHHKLQGPNPGATEFVPKTNPSSLQNNISLTHSASTPSFADYASFSARMNGPTSTANTTHSPQHAQLPPGVVSAGHSPRGSPGLSPTSSPLTLRRNKSPVASLANPNPLQGVQDVGGTTYFYSQEEMNAQSAQSQVVFPNFTVHPGILPHMAHMKPKSNMPSFFMPDEMKLEILNRHALTLAQINPEENPDIPSEVDNYHCLFPLEPRPTNPMHKSSTFGYQTSVYKATNTKNGLCYCLRRIHGFRLGNTKCMELIDLWKEIMHSNIVQLREVFTTKAFGDHSMVFVYDYHPGAETLMSRHFCGPPPANGYNSSPFRMEGSASARPFSASAGKGGGTVGGGNANGGPQSGQSGLLPESLIWSYIVQLSSALRTIHAHRLACRVMDPTKILLTDKSRIRMNCVGIFDVLSFDSSQATPMQMMPHYQQEDLVSLGKVVLALACNSVIGIQRENLQNSLDLVTRNYSADLKNLILYLLTNQTRLRSINDIMPMIGARFYTQLDAAQLRTDVLENELGKEVENARLFRIICRLGIINDRPEFHMDPAWSETGDRYMLKLFRDYVFHQVDQSGLPWIDLAHVVQCLNKLDTGLPEKICLMSRDEQSVLVTSFAELKQCYEAAFAELLSASNQQPPPALS